MELVPHKVGAKPEQKKDESPMKLRLQDEWKEEPRIFKLVVPRNMNSKLIKLFRKETVNPLTDILTFQEIMCFPELFTNDNTAIFEVVPEGETDV